MAQHMIRDIQTLLSRMEVSGQGWPLPVSLYPPYPFCLSLGMTGHIHWVLPS